MTEHENIMFTKFYNPSIQYTSIKNLYDAVKKDGITLQEVKNFIQKQETTQIFNKKATHKKLLSNIGYT